MEESAPGGGAATTGDDVKNGKVAEMHSLNLGVTVTPELRKSLQYWTDRSMWLRGGDGGFEPDQHLPIHKIPSIIF